MSGNHDEPLRHTMSDEPIIWPYSDEPLVQDDLYTYELASRRQSLDELKEMCICKGMWVESPCAISSVGNAFDYQRTGDELHVMMTLTDVDLRIEHAIAYKLYIGELVRAEDLPDGIDLPEYKFSKGVLEKVGAEPPEK